ncbi:FAD-binding protein [Shewanella fidelis]|uniref:FAD-binding protein n=1 Tax=Shewanella fidelis TaxID=173509 RepID=A0AAW8NUK6_9GAMM|nr:FAD-binding protein [Shewanella fidelis]MDR8525639.1 FAD-binding protein [Shewanella fidelis]MDW4812851.1 FAD-binding protein [Shewanella fidelis]MDW4816599.1 FAD-binding protein [Shewanella fidelis]MDW4820237.1 FAD-binding protein [Shewanella fidelis]MDW4825316.1 FAD-binding protein [Shewanella fidelis]
MSKLSNIWVFSDIASRLPEMIAAGAALGEKVSAFIIGTESEITAAYTLGATNVYYLGEKDSQKITEDYSHTIAQVIAANSQNSLVLLAPTKRGKALASKLGVQLQAGVVNDVTEINVENGVHAKHMAYGGLAIAEEKINSQIAIMTLSSGLYEALPVDPSRTGEAVNVTFIEPTTSITCIERRAKQGESVDLGKAKRVIGVGSGIGSQENLQVANELAALMGAELGCSRPIAETEKWMERERYIGVSGVMLKPEVYLALGISGQIQHMVGALGSQTILAVNKDKNAPIFQYADYGIVGDINKVMPALISALKA